MSRSLAAPTVLTGWFNFTKAMEENNTENFLVPQDASTAVKYATNCRSTSRISNRITARNDLWP